MGLIMYEYDTDDPQIPVSGLIGLIAGAAVLLVMLLSLGDVALISWTEITIAALLAVIIGGIAAIVERYVASRKPKIINRDSVWDAPVAGLIGTEHEIADAGRTSSIDQADVEPDFVTIRLGRPFNVSPEMAEAIEKVQEARGQGLLDRVSQRRLNDEAGIDRYGSLGGELIELLFLAGMLKKSANNIYDWTDKGQNYFDGYTEVINEGSTYPFDPDF